MKLNQLLSYEGVFAAVKCVRCGAIYDASSQEFIGLHGELTLGLVEPIVDVPKPGMGRHLWRRWPIQMPKTSVLG